MTALDARVDRAALAHRFESVRKRVAAAADRAGRAGSAITIVAVAKTISADVVADALAAGVTDIGENRAQEFREKQAVLGTRARWHFIGPLQSNKVRHVVGKTVLVHSVDRFALADAMAARARALGVEQPVLIEVNVGGEASKHGVEPAHAVPLAEKVAALGGLAVRGVMAIPPLVEDPEHSRPYFRDVAEIADEVRARVPDAVEISMGMTRDFEVAVEEGATIVRVGEAIFGPRRTARAQR